MRKGIFFSTDALFALVIIIVLVPLLGLLVTQSFTSERIGRTLNFEAQDAVEVLATVTVSEVAREPAIQEALKKGYITDDDLNTTLLELIGSLWSSDNATLEVVAQNITKSVFSKFVGSNAQWAVFIENETVYNTSLPSAQRALSVGRKLASGFRKGAPSEGFIANIVAKDIEKLSSSFAFFGGFIGEGNITALMRDIPANATPRSVVLELDVKSNITLYINNNYCSKLNATIINPQIIAANTWNITSATCLTRIVPGSDNTFKIIFNGVNFSDQFIGGGFIKVSYDTNQLVVPPTNTTRYSFHGIEGLIDIFDSFYVPGTLRSMTVFLHFNHQNTLNLTIGNKTVYSGTGSGVDETVVLTDATLSTLLNYAALSKKTIPLSLRLTGFATAIVPTDSVLITDTSGSMQICDVGVNYTGCGTNLEQRLAAAKEADRVFVDTILQSNGSRIGLVEFGSTVKSSLGLTGSKTLLDQTINGYAYGGGTCIECGILKAAGILVDDAGALMVANRSIWKVEDAFAGVGGEPPAQGSLTWKDTGYNDNAWDSKQAPFFFYQHGSNLLVNYHFSENNTRAQGILDNSLNNNHATVGSDNYLKFRPNFTTGGAYGSAWYFNGIDNYIAVPVLQSMKAPKNLTIMSWVRINKTNADDIHAIISRNGRNNKRDWFLAVGSETPTGNGVNNIVQFQVSGDCKDKTRIGGNTTLLKNQWYHIAATYNSTSRQMKVYVNGVENTNYSSLSDGPIPSSLCDSGNNVRIGQRADGQGHMFNGTIDELRVYNVTLTSQQIANVYNNQSFAVQGPYYVRKTIAVGNNFSSFDSIKAYLRYDDGVELYINNNLAYTGTSNNNGTYWTAIVPISKSLLTLGTNTIAAKISNDDGASAEFDMELIGTLPKKAMLIMSDGEATTVSYKAPHQSYPFEAKKVALDTACDIHSRFEIQLYTVSFGNSGDDASMRAIASCDDPNNFFEGSDLDTLKNVYKTIAQLIVNTTLEEQTINILGNFSSVLYHDSHINISYEPEITLPDFKQIALTFETDTFPSCTASFFVPPVAGIEQALVTSYSGDIWTENVTLTNSAGVNQVLHLGEYGTSYQNIGDPYKVNIPPSLISLNKINTIKVALASASGNQSSRCSQNNRIIYTARLSAAGTSVNVLPVLAGRTVTVYHDSNYDGIVDGSTALAVGSTLPVFNPTPVDIDALNPTENAVDAAIINLMNTLNFVVMPGNAGAAGTATNPIDVKITALDTEIIANKNVPFAWGPADISFVIWV